MRAAGVCACDEETYTIRSPSVLLRVGLGAGGDLGDDVGEWDGSGEGEAFGEGLLFHEVGEDAGVGSEAGECEAVVCVDWYYLFLVGGEFFGIAL